jgi:hypothetical protein
VGEYNSIQFGVDGKPVSTDATAINKTIHNGNALPDGARVSAVRVTTGELSRAQFGLNAGATQGPTTQTAQLRDVGNTVAVGGQRVSPEVAETLRKQAPHLFAEEVPSAQPSAPSAQPNATAGEPASEHAAPVEDPLDAIENPLGKEIVEELRGVGVGHQAAVIVASMKGDQAAMDVAIGRLASAIGVEKHLATGKVAIALTEMSKQAGRLAAEKGIDYAAFNRWARNHYSDTAAQLVLRHLQGGSVRNAWGSLMDKFAARGGR